MSENEAAFLDNARRALDGAADNLDMPTAARLTAARRRALDASRRVPPWRRGWLIAAGGFAAAGLVAIVVASLLWPITPNHTVPVSVANSEDLELLSAQENPDFYADLDFYDWLASRDNSASRGDS